MRLLFVCNEYPPAPHGGIGTFVKTLAQELTFLGHQVCVVGYDHSVPATGWSQDGEVQVLRIRPRFQRAPRLRISRYVLDSRLVLDRMYLSRVIKQVAQDTQADLVESFDWGGPFWFKPFTPLVVRLHGANTAHQFYENKKISRLLMYFERKNIAMADRLAAVSEHIGSTTLRAVKLEHLSYTVIFNGVDTRVFAPSGTTQKRSNSVLYVGRIHPRKGIEELLRAWPRVIHAVPEAQLTLVGDMPENLNSLTTSVPSSIRHTLHFTGYVPYAEIAGYYNQAAAAVFPSRAEAFGLTCAEAMACGTAVVMTKHASGPELIQHGIDGLLADPADPVELSEAIITLLTDQRLREQLAEQARQTALARFDVKQLAAANLRFYESILND